MSITIKTGTDIDAMRVACKLASEVLDYLTPSSNPVSPPKSWTSSATTTWSTNRLRPRPPELRPGRPRALPKSICASINHQVCHGIPNDRPLKDGDIVNLDITVIKNGLARRHQPHVHRGAMAPSPPSAWCAFTYEAMWKGIAKVKPGARLGDIGHAIQTFAEKQWLFSGARVLRPRHWREVP
jgi:methionyl aminopeptidase